VYLDLFQRRIGLSSRTKKKIARHPPFLLGKRLSLTTIHGVIRHLPAGDLKGGAEDLGTNKFRHSEQLTQWQAHGVAHSTDEFLFFEDTVDDLLDATVSVRGLTRGDGEETRERKRSQNRDGKDGWLWGNESSFTLI
jgi:hypothetical protein